MLVPDTTPYPWPYDGEFRPSRAALVICGSGAAWSNRCRLDPSVESNIDRLRSSAAGAGVTVVLLRHPEPPRVDPLEEGHADALDARNGEVIVEAAGIDGFYGSPLDSVLRSLGRDQLVFVGRGFEAAVHSTVRRANDRGYESLTVADACASLDRAIRAASISTIEMSGGIFGAVGSTAAVINTLTHFPPEASS